jgi:hypothetical protein
MSQLINKLRQNHLFVASAVLALTTVLYCVGFTYIYIPVALFFIVLTVPMPSVFNSFIGRLVPSLLIFFGLYQIVATLQQFFYRENGFIVAAIVMTVLLIASAHLFSISQKNRNALIKSDKIISANDIAGIAALLIFLIPFTGLLLKGDMYENIAQVGGIQAIDGVNHWGQIYSNSYAETIRYDRDHYFPAGFHITTAFIQDSIGLNPTTVSNWKVNSIAFIAHYAIMAALLIATSVYLVFGLVRDKLTNWRRFLIIAGLVPSLIVFFVVPFIYNGFLNHIYMCAAIILAATIFIERYGEKQTKEARRQAIDPLYAYYVVAYGAALSWPLIAPPLILAPLLIGLSGFKWKFNRQLIMQLLPYVLGTLLLAVPVLIQYFTSPIGPASSILLDGGLKIWHVGLYFACAVFVVWLTLKQRVLVQLRAFGVFGVSFLLLIVGLALLQYFVAGDVRYYTIKTSSFLEIFILVLFVYGVAVAIDKSKSLINLAVGVLAIPTIFVLAISFNDNPLKDTRSLFRAYSHEEKPPYFNADTHALLGPAMQNKIQDGNYMTLHYAPESGKIFAHPQVPFFFNSMKKDMVRGDKMSSCLKEIYKILLFGNYTDQSQIELKKTINECAVIVGENNEPYVILTDTNSYSAIESMFSANKNIKVIGQDEEK